MSLLTRIRLSTSLSGAKEGERAGGRAPLEQIAQDVRYGLRQIRRNPAFSAIAAAS